MSETRKPYTGLPPTMPNASVANPPLIRTVDPEINVETELSHERFIGEGNFGRVYSYCYTGGNKEIEDNYCVEVKDSVGNKYHYVIVKEFKNAESEDTKNEVAMARITMQIPHPNCNLYKPVILKTSTGTKQGLLSALCTYDYRQVDNHGEVEFEFSTTDLHKYDLRKPGSVTNPSGFGHLFDEDRDINAAHALYDMHAGIHHLHTAFPFPIAHCDIASRNGLFKRDKRDLEKSHNGVPVGLKTQVIDVGLAKVLDERGEAKVTSNEGPLMWMDPKSLREHIVTCYSDIFALRIKGIESACGFTSDQDSNFHWVMSAGETGREVNGEWFGENVVVGMNAMENGAAILEDYYSRARSIMPSDDGTRFLGSFGPYIAPDYGIDASLAGHLPTEERTKYIKELKNQAFYNLDLQRDAELLRECYDNFFLDTVLARLQKVISRPTTANVNSFLNSMYHLMERMPTEELQNKYADVFVTLKKFQQENIVTTEEDTARLVEEFKTLNFTLHTLNIERLRKELASIHEIYDKAIKTVDETLERFDREDITMEDINFTEIDPFQKHAQQLSRLKKIKSDEVPSIGITDINTLKFQELNTELDKAITILEITDQSKWDRIADIRDKYIAQKSVEFNQLFTDLYEQYSELKLNIKSHVKSNDQPLLVAKALGLLLQMQKIPAQASNIDFFVNENKYWETNFAPRKTDLVIKKLHKNFVAEFNKVQDYARGAQSAYHSLPDLLNPNPGTIPRILVMSSNQDPAISLIRALNDFQKTFGSKENIDLLLKTAESLRKANAPNFPIAKRLKLLSLHLTNLQQAKEAFKLTHGDITADKLELLALLHNQKLSSEIKEKQLTGFLNLKMLETKTTPQIDSTYKEITANLPQEAIVTVPNSPLNQAITYFYKKQNDYINSLQNFIDVFMNPDGSIKQKILVNNMEVELKKEDQILLQHYITPYLEILAKYREQSSDAESNILKQDTNDDIAIATALAFHVNRDKRITDQCVMNAVAFKNLLENIGYKDKINAQDHSVDLAPTLFLPLTHLQDTSKAFQRIVDAFPEESQAIESRPDPLPEKYAEQTAAITHLQSNLDDQVLKTTQAYTEEITKKGDRTTTTPDLLESEAMKIRSMQNAQIKKQAKELYAHVDHVYAQNKKAAKTVKETIRKMEVFGIDEKKDQIGIQRAEQVKIIFKDLLTKNTPTDVKAYILTKFPEPEIKIHRDPNSTGPTKLEGLLLAINQADAPTGEKRARNKGVKPPKPTLGIPFDFNETPPPLPEEEKTAFKNLLTSPIVISPTVSTHSNVTKPVPATEKPSLKEIFEQLDKILSELEQGIFQFDKTMRPKPSKLDSVKALFFNRKEDAKWSLPKEEKKGKFKI